MTIHYVLFDDFHLMLLSSLNIIQLQITANYPILSYWGVICGISINKYWIKLSSNSAQQTVSDLCDQLSVSFNGKLVAFSMCCCLIFVSLEQSASRTPGLVLASTVYLLLVIGGLQRCDIKQLWKRLKLMFCLLIFLSLKI